MRHARERALLNLCEADFRAVRPYLEPVELELGAQLASAGDPITAVCFPEACVIVLADGQRPAIGLVGREGFVGWLLIL